MSDSVDPLKVCVAQLKRFPGVGERSATRLVYWLLRQEPHVAAEIVAALLALPEAMTRCSTCGDISAVDPCPICSDENVHQLRFQRQPRRHGIQPIREGLGRWHGGGRQVPISMMPLQTRDDRYRRCRVTFQISSTRRRTLCDEVVTTA